MADKRISLVIAAKNMLAGGLNSASNDLKKFSDKAGKGGFMGGGGMKAGVIGGIVAGITAIAAASIKSVAAFMEQEKAERNLADAIKMHGESVSALLPKMNDFSNKMLDQAGIGDEITMQRMANMKSLGMETSQLEMAAKGVAGLTRAGMGEEAAQRALVSATQGNFEALGRYIPALKSATTEQEKAKAVNDFISNQWHMQKKDLETLGGSWGLLKNRVGDFAEESGRKISKFFKLKELFTGVGNAIKNLTPDNSEDIAQMAADYDKAAKESKEKIILAKADEVKAEEEASKKKIEIAKLETAIKNQKMQESRIQWERQQKEMEKIAKLSVREFIDGEKAKAKSRGLSPSDQRKFEKLDAKQKAGGFMFKSDQAFLDEAKRKQAAFENNADTPERAADRKRFEALQKKAMGGGETVKGLKNLSLSNLTAKEKEFMKSFSTTENAKAQEAVAKKNLEELDKAAQLEALDGIRTQLDDNQKTLNKLLVGG